MSLNETRELVRALVTKTAPGASLTQLEAAMERMPDPRAIQDVKAHVIALAWDRGAGDQYSDVMSALGELLRDRAHRPTVVVEAEFENAAARYADLKERSEQAVTRWEWATWITHKFEPFYFERNRQSRGRRMKTAPKGKPKSGTHAYGFDSEGRLRVVRQYNEIGCYETFLEHVADQIDSYHYSYNRNRDPINVTRIVLENGIPVERACFAAHGLSNERYEVRGDQVVAIETESWDESLGRRDTREEVSYDNLGRVQVIERVSVTRRMDVWRRPQKGESLRELLPMIHEHIRTKVLEAVASIELEEPAYALCLCMSGAAYDHLLPPQLAIALASEREGFIAEHGAKAASTLWHPVEWRLYDDDAIPELGDERMNALCTVANQLLWEKKKGKSAFKLVDDLAKELNKIELPMPRTDDFVVFACDITVGDGVKGVRRAAPADLKKRLAPLLKMVR